MPKPPTPTELSDIDTESALLGFDPDNPSGPADEPSAAEPVEATKAALSATVTGFLARAKTDASRFTQATDSEFWVCFCFETRAQKEEFLKALKLDGLGDKHVNGLAAARRLGVKILSPRAPWGAPRTSARLNALAVDDNDD